VSNKANIKTIQTHLPSLQTCCKTKVTKIFSLQKARTMNAITITKQIISRSLSLSHSLSLHIHYYL
jgi:hypothetical protein